MSHCILTGNEQAKSFIGYPIKFIFIFSQELTQVEDNHILIGIVCDINKKKESFFDDVTTVLVPAPGLVHCDRMNGLPKNVINHTFTGLELLVDMVMVQPQPLFDCQKCKLNRIEVGQISKCCQCEL